jgi:cytochrome c oxidase cbb3-type subunit 2/cytochrome c oxidase cbb3-type subunit I/II
MRMTPALVLVGSMLVVWAAIIAVVVVPTYTIPDRPSEIWRPLTPLEERGQKLFIANGCTYCHSQYIRPMDWDIGSERIAKSEDYYRMTPHLLGSERTGPDLSQEGGEHSDDWQIAHFINPRFTRPESLMPSFAFLERGGAAALQRYVQGSAAKPRKSARTQPGDLDALVAYVQSRGWRDADYRTARQRYWQSKAVAAFMAGPDANIEWLHSMVPAGWRNIPNPYPADSASISRGQKIYQQFCIGCHGPVGDGQGPAAPYLLPRPLNFTTLKRHLVGGKYIGGILYYQIMNGITGTAMPYHKKDLESEKIWDVSNFIAANFIGYTDSNVEPKGIDASYETPETRGKAPVFVPPTTGRPTR